MSTAEPVNRWLQYLASERRYSAHTISGYRQDLFLLQNLYPDTPLNQLSNGQLRQAVARLHSEGHKPRSLARALAAWRGFYQWWAPQIGLAHNPATDIRAPKIPRSLPKALSVEQTQVLLDRPNLPAPHTPIECRDQAMFEILYSAGLRLSELTSLDTHYVHTAKYTSGSWLQLADAEVVVTGKGGKTRHAPLGRQAIAALERWLALRADMIKPQTGLTPGDNAALFLGERGKRISGRVVQLQLNKLARQAGLPVNVHPHSLRHSFASHLLQSAQDLRAVQELLGHANIATTQIYTRLDFQHLAKVYDQAHPRANRRHNNTGGTPTTGTEVTASTKKSTDPRST